MKHKDSFHQHEVSPLPPETSEQPSITAPRIWESLFWLGIWLNDVNHDVIFTNAETNNSTYIKKHMKIYDISVGLCIR